MLLLINLLIYYKVLKTFKLKWKEEKTRGKYVPFCEIMIKRKKTSITCCLFENMIFHKILQPNNENKHHITTAPNEYLQLSFYQLKNKEFQILLLQNPFQQATYTIRPLNPSLHV